MNNISALLKELCAYFRLPFNGQQEVMFQDDNGGVWKIEVESEFNLIAISSELEELEHTTELLLKLLALNNRKDLTWGAMFSYDAEPGIYNLSYCIPAALCDFVLIKNVTENLIVLRSSVISEIKQEKVEL